MRGFLFSIEALMGYLILAYLIMSVHLGVDSSSFSQVLLKKHTQDLVIVSGYDGTYDWIRNCSAGGVSIQECGNVCNHVVSQVGQLSGGLGVVIRIDGVSYCGEAGEKQQASSRDIIYLSGDETISVEFIIYVK